MTLQVHSLRKEYGLTDSVEVAVNGVTIEIAQGEFVSLVGPSGCGKSTTLRCIAGLETPTSGEISFEGLDITDVPPEKRNIAMMFQNIALYPHMTIRENIAYPLKVQRTSVEERNQRCEETASLMQIQELLDKYPGELSGGQRQRAALARTIIQEPKIFLMDEPLSDLDAKLKVEMRKEIQKVHKRLGKPTLYVTHDQEEAMTMSDRVLVMNGGIIEQEGTPRELYERPNNIFVANFIGNPSMNFTDAKVLTHEANSCSIQAYGEEFRLHDIDASTDIPDSVIIGFRPESVTVGSRTNCLSFNVDVSLIETIGERSILTLQAQEEEIQILAPAGLDIHEGDEAIISIPPNLMYLFDSQSGDLLIAPDLSSDDKVEA